MFLEKKTRTIKECSSMMLKIIYNDCSDFFLCVNAQKKNLHYEINSQSILLICEIT